jgi:iron complex transport system substrate-binding protein
LAALASVAEPVCVRDSLDREVCLAAPAQRIVTLAPHLAENVFSAGAGDRLVGVTRYSDYPLEARALPRIGDFNAFSLERIAELAPDLVMVWGSGNGAGALANLEKLGFTVYVDELRKLEDIPGSIRNIGSLAGTSATAETVARDFIETINALRSRADIARISVFYQIWNTPLQTIGADHMISEVITLCGGRNLFADNALLAPQVSLEAVLARDPQLIVASGMDGREPPWLADWQRFPNLTAVRAGTVLFIHPDTLQRPTVRLAEGSREMCALITEARERLANQQ